MNWQVVGKFLKDYGVLGVVIAAVAGGIGWVSTVDAKLGLLKDTLEKLSERLESRIERTTEAISGKDGLRVQLTNLLVQIKYLETSNTELQCKLTLTYTMNWYRDFELQLWARPIDELSKAGSDAVRHLSDHIQQFERNLKLCYLGRKELTRLRSLLDGLTEYDLGNYGPAYDSIKNLDRSQSLTQRFLCAAKSKQADDSGDPKMRRQADQHCSNAFTMAEGEPTSTNKDTAVKILKCNSYSSATEVEARKGANCYVRLAQSGIKPSFAYAAAASFYAAIDDFENAMIMLRKYKLEPVKEIGREALKRDKDLLKLLTTPFTDEYQDLLENSTILP